MMPLSRALQPLLDVLRERGPMTTADVHESVRPPIKITGTNNRLTELYRLGFLTRQRGDGRSWIWDAKGAPDDERGV